MKNILFPVFFICLVLCFTTGCNSHSPSSYSTGSMAWFDTAAVENWPMLRDNYDDAQQAWQNMPMAKLETCLTMCDVNARDHAGRTALFYAAGFNADPEIVKTLIDAGAKVNARNSDDVTVLMFAAYSNTNPEVLTTLIRAGAKVNAHDGNGMTVLMSAIFGLNNVNVVTALLDAGAKVDARSQYGDNGADPRSFPAFRSASAHSPHRRRGRGGCP